MLHSRSRIARTRRGYILCFGVAEGEREAIRKHLVSASMVNQQLLDMSEDVEDVRAFISSIRRCGDDLEVVFAPSMAFATHRALLDSIREGFPVTRWIVSAPSGAAGPIGGVPEGATLVPEPVEAGPIAAYVQLATQEYRRARRQRLLSALEQVRFLQSLGPDDFLWLSRRVELRGFEAGEVVFRQGEPGDGAYLVLQGEVAVLGGSEGREQVARLGRHEVFGEIALLTGDPRSATVMSATDAELLFIHRTDWEKLIASHPDIAVGLARMLSTRLGAAMRPTRRAPRVIACCSCSSDEQAVALASSLARAIEAETLRKAATLDLASPGGEQTLRPAQLGARLEELKKAATFVVAAEGRDLPREVSNKLLKQCDAFLLLVSRTKDGVAEARRRLDAMLRDVPVADHKVEVVLQTDGAAEVPLEEIAASLGRGLEYRIDLSKAVTGGTAVDASLRRLARQAIGIGVGLVLGGGGARAFAHIGVLEVLEANGIPIDYVCGVSAGAYMAALYATGRPLAEVKDCAVRSATEGKAFSDFTIPRTSLLRGKRYDAILQETLGEVRIEELPIPYFSVAADLVSGLPVVIDQGPLWEAVRASGRLPGILPPVVRDEACLVDGGVLNNVPGDVMKERGARLVVGVNVTPHKVVRLGRDGDGKPPGVVGKLLRKSRRMREFLDAPGILQVLARTIDIQGLETIRSRTWSFDVYLRPHVPEFGMLEFKSWAAIIERGRKAAQEALPILKEQLDAVAKEL